MQVDGHRHERRPAAPTSKHGARERPHGAEVEVRVVIGLAALALDAERRLGARHPRPPRARGRATPTRPRAGRRSRRRRRSPRPGSSDDDGLDEQQRDLDPGGERPEPVTVRTVRSTQRLPHPPEPFSQRPTSHRGSLCTRMLAGRLPLRVTGYRRVPRCGRHTRLIRVSRRRCGQGRGRTADLPLFRRSLVPTELPGRGRCRSTGRRGATQTGLEPATFAVTGRRANQLRHWAKLVLPVKRTPNGIRTRVAALKGRSPRRLDDGDSNRRDRPGRAPTVRWERGQA